MIKIIGKKWSTSPEQVVKMDRNIHLVEDYFEKITESSPQTQISNRIKSIAGKINLPEDFDEEQELRRALEEKYLK